MIRIVPPAGRREHPIKVGLRLLDCCRPAKKTPPYDKLKFIYIELPKFKKQEDELETQFDKWLFVFRHLSNLQNRPQQLQDKIFQRLFEAAEIAKFSAEEREAYEDSLKYYRDLKNVVDTSREEGVLEGIEQGIEKRNLEIAKQMKKEGESIEKIMRYTNIT